MDYPEQLPPAYAIGDSDAIEIVCERHALEFANESGLVWYHAPALGGFTEETDTGQYAYELRAGEGETDTPYTCGAWLDRVSWDSPGYCGDLLDCSLTLEGEDYVRENFPASVWHLWGVEDQGVTA
jgi:hypothetical protein